MKQLMERIKNYIQDLKSGEKKISKDAMLILFFSGVLIYVILLPANNNSSYRNKASDSDERKTIEYALENTLQTDYQEKLERELSEFLSEVEGVGKVEVLIYVSGTDEFIVEKDETFRHTTQAESDCQSTEENKEEDTVYTVNDAGEQVPFVAKTNHPSIEGVIIAAEGGGQEEVRIKIIRTVMALYGVDANKIDVVMKKKS